MTETDKTILEALLFAAGEPLSAWRLADVLDDATPARVETLLAALDDEYRREGRAFQVQSVAAGWQLGTRPELARWVSQLFRTGAVPRLTQAALETLAIIAYKQPVARSELEAIRGVSVDAVLRTLVERDLVAIAGRGESLGRPLLYATTGHFLEYFGLTGLDALPRPEELEILFADRERQGEFPLEPPVPPDA
ncbi:MAG: SMC-Scp complex subunit ScpB [Gemmatimonadota bacterium]